MASNEYLSVPLNLLGVKLPAWGKDMVGDVIESGTVRWHAPNEVEVGPHVEEGEDEAEDKGFEEVAGLPVLPPLSCFPPDLLQLSAYGFVIVLD